MSIIYYRGDDMSDNNDLKYYLRKNNKKLIGFCSKNYFYSKKGSMSKELKADLFLESYRKLSLYDREIFKNKLKIMTTNTSDEGLSSLAIGLLPVFAASYLAMLLLVFSHEGIAIGSTIVIGLLIVFISINGILNGNRSSRALILLLATETLLDLDTKVKENENAPMFKTKISNNINK